MDRSPKVSRVRGIKCLIILSSVLLALVSVCFHMAVANAQALPTAVRSLAITTFAGLSGENTGLSSGRNVSVTVGFDLAFQPVHHILPAVEARGQFPIYDGNVYSQRDLLTGLKLGKRCGRFMPYVDFLGGRAQINYGAGYISPDKQFVYKQSVSNIFSPGIGVDIGLDDHFSLKVEDHLKLFNTPVTVSGHLVAQSLTVAAVYRFSFYRRPSR